MRAAVTVLCLALLAACAREPGTPPGGFSVEAAARPPAPDAGGGAPPPAFFEEVAESLGLDFRHRNGAIGGFHMAEISGSGVGLLDYDNDGDLDVYFVQGGDLGGTEGGRDQLYRNDLDPAAGPGSLRFTDVSAEAGELGDGYGMSVAVGDYDGDGWVDLFVTGLHGTQLLRNQKDGTFRDVTEETGVGVAGWTVPAAFVDLDGDGVLDLYVGGYVRYGEPSPRCRDFAGALDYCGPEQFEPLPDSLFLGRGDGTFEDVSGRLRGAPPAPALGVVVAQLDVAAGVELYVANDGAANHLWAASAGGELVDQALLLGCSVNASGQAEASMGVDAGDFDGDGDLDLFMTHLVSETNTLFRNDGARGFADVTTAADLAAASRLRTAFGTAWLDVDADGWLDLFVANGAVRRIEELARRGDGHPFHEPNQLFLGDGRGGFSVARIDGSAAPRSEVSRGVAAGDLDHDGDVDLVLSNNGGPARLLRARGAPEAWVGVEIAADPTAPAAPPAYAHGASVELQFEERVLLRRVRMDGSYASAGDARVTFSLPSAPEELRARVHYGDGATEEFGSLRPGSYNRLVRGRGGAGSASERSSVPGETP